MIFNPSIIITIPEIKLIYLKTPPINIIVDEKITLKTTKTTVKPKIKPIVLAIGLGLLSSLPVIGEPPITHRYDGISGITHGDKKDSTPAPKAINIDIFSETI
jgi:hypothetical protein